MRLLSHSYTDSEQVALEQAWAGLQALIPDEQMAKARAYIHSIANTQYRMGVRDGKQEMRQRIQDILEDKVMGDSE